MQTEYRMKVFKSGNSLAVRLPKALGFEEGTDVVVVPHADGSISFWRESDNAQQLDALYGAFSSGFMSQGRGDTSQEERSWDRHSRDAAA